MKRTLKKSLVFLSISIFFAFVGFLVASITIFDSKPKFKNVRTNGINVSAEVIFKNKEFYSCGQSTCSKHILKVLYFDKAPRESKTVDFPLGMFLDFPVINVGNSHSASVLVSSSIYRKTKTGDSIEIAYLPEDFDKVWLATNIKNWNAWNAGLWFTTICLSIGLISLYFTFRFSHIEEKRWLELGL